MNRQRTGGATLAGAGVLLLATLLALGSLRHPADAAETTQPIEYVAIGAALCLVTVGVVVVLATYVET
ncbi:hypothetical protein [Halovivax sp.]|uniref:hypothetical protein n=1 Tax=Halovivax sp. TaxID=1935978 RepID=UPI0025BF3EFD|nr:hypothetical protein [Halovivax sp.]